MYLMMLAAAIEPTKYLIVSSPAKSKIDYYPVIKGKFPRRATNLVDSVDVKQPKGLAVDKWAGPDGKPMMRLYVTDPGQRKILFFPLLFANGELVAGTKTVIMTDTEATWLTVDGLGNIFFSGGARQNLVTKLDGASLRAPQPMAHATSVYDGEKNDEVDSPGGITTDNFKVYWTNKAKGTQVGSVVAGVSNPDPDSTVALSKITSNVNEVNGVCLAMNNLYYTGRVEEPVKKSVLYGVKKTGGAFATITDKLLAPQGCVWDGDSTVYVADGESIYGFPANMGLLQATTLRKVALYTDGAFSLAMIQASSAALYGLLLFAALS
jgi:hypothetical protein